MMKSQKVKILAAVGTRPEAIKMAPVIQGLQQQPWAECRVLATAQHREMLDQVLALFAIQPDADLDIMQANQDLVSLTARLLPAIAATLDAETPDLVLAQGDTTTVLTMALAAFYKRIPFGHVEAGLRTGDLAYPFPEEMNRVLSGHLARWHFAPTDSARRNLLREGISDNAVHVTGNTVIDALLGVVDQAPEPPVELGPEDRLILVTAHRRENFGEPFRAICGALRRIADAYPDVQILYPVHPNPNVREVAEMLLRGHRRITLCEPLGYLPFVGAMRRAHFILTDSGGVQEEAPALGKPVLVLRHETERPEAIDAGVVRLVGPVQDRIIEASCKLLDDPAAYAAMARGLSPYGDGHAASRIIQVLGAHFGVQVAL
ncbi:MAG: UDP-N-acetylglucosamine 2-epimerase (non-hydrolyzing) [Lamprobacter sp.]|uniref:non-hydrolyzing UDP-N-acetylglucosamine 2-epimerase n=1 Tax=Lamprobacter sp. TaxID=3100796 RepID=UPI002B258132|nr:UDP-N-acetylglucosamine 2-epimerase (non-hydrolyzing) [Lamprobacter sp.]MEA3638328.1 UDP-N-acetylglucosamine 2-epimerase (non-hydrolyzing) [Lamprobacter sp.]